MTPEIDQLDADILALKVERERLLQAHLASIAIAQPGEVITWTLGSRQIKGRVIGFEIFAGGIGYRAIAIDGVGRDDTHLLCPFFFEPVKVAS